MIIIVTYFVYKNTNIVDCKPKYINCDISLVSKALERGVKIFDRLVELAEGKKIFESSIFKGIKNNGINNSSRINRWAKVTNHELNLLIK